MRRKEFRERRVTLSQLAYAKLTVSETAVKNDTKKDDDVSPA